MVINHLHSLKLSESVKIGDPKRKQSSSNHPFSGALADSFREGTSTGSPPSTSVKFAPMEPNVLATASHQKIDWKSAQSFTTKPDISIVLLGCLVDRGHVKNRMVLIIESPFFLPLDPKNHGKMEVF